MRSILLLPLVARYIETIDVCIWHMFVFMSVVVTVSVSIFCRTLPGCAFSGHPLARGDWYAFQWSPTGRLEIKLTILWL